MSEWISVEDRLPDENVRVLMWFRAAANEWRATFGEINCGHWRPEGGNGNFDDRVTHWMRLPDSPVASPEKETP